jgi:sugar-specific transcriptional regulator TrmB
MERIVEKLGSIGLTEYEAKVYLALLEVHLNTATKASEKSGVPRTRIYSVLESLARKGWVRISSGVPLLFKITAPQEAFEKIKEEYGEFLDSVKSTLKEEVREMKDKFVIKKFDIKPADIRSVSSDYE